MDICLRFFVALVLCLFDGVWIYSEAGLELPSLLASTSRGL